MSMNSFLLLDHFVHKSKFLLETVVTWALLGFVVRYVFQLLIDRELRFMNFWTCKYVICK